jgi:osmotically-inducible protein OsmY
MRVLVFVLLLALSLPGCTTVASQAYSSATDERSLAVQAEDTKIATKIKKGLLDSGAKNLLAIDVFCHQGLVVLTGVVEPGSTTGEQAVALARGVDGVKRVETYYLPGRPSMTSDLAISAKLKARIIGDGELKASQVDVAVIAGHVVLTGVVDRRAKIDAVIRHARAVEAVTAVKSYIQVKSP